MSKIITVKVTAITLTTEDSRKEKTFVTTLFVTTLLVTILFATFALK